MDEEHEDLGTDPAAAFEALRAEVAALRAGLEQGRDGQVPDYALTLGKIAATLAAIEAHPALELTPEAFAYQVHRAREAAQQQGGRELANAVQRVDAAGAELERLAGRHRTGREQARQVAVMTAVGAVAGVVLWVCFSGPIARAMPASWSVPERMAAATLRLDQWNAGVQLMRTADPASWNGLTAASSLWRGNADALEACARSTARTGKAQRCTVVITPNAGQAKD